MSKIFKIFEYKDVHKGLGVGSVVDYVVAKNRKESLKNYSAYSNGSKEITKEEVEKLYLNEVKEIKRRQKLVSQLEKILDKEK